MKRTCPRCRVGLKRTNIASERATVEIDRCDVCKGLYLDDGELRDLTGRRSLARWMVKHANKGQPCRLTCPGCGGCMDSLTPGKVQVEVCLSCHGIWLDWSELNILINVTEDELKQAEEDLEDPEGLLDTPAMGGEHSGPVSLLGWLSRKAHKR